MTPKQYQDAASYHAEQCSELAEFLALPVDYFSPRSAQHWYQVVSRSEVQESYDSSARMIAHYEALAEKSS